MTPAEAKLKQIIKDLKAENTEAWRERAEQIKLAKIETEARFWRACYEELIDKVMKDIRDDR